MKILLGILLFPIVAFSQENIGIGTVDPDESAMLDVSSEDKGLLIPRVELISKTDQKAIEEPAISLLVYNKKESKDRSVIPGFYYWDGEMWRKLCDELDLDR
ncbi:MAG: hypothetical protein MRY83_14735 [Flavobacteriales bacterium]|nr:hypothetical protein [Flavobacteriales bacterium]